MARPRLVLDVGRVVVRGPLSAEAVEALRSSLEAEVRACLTSASSAAPSGPLAAPSAGGEARFVRDVAAKVASVATRESAAARGGRHG